MPAAHSRRVGRRRRPRRGRPCGTAAASVTSSPRCSVDRAAGAHRLRRGRRPPHRAGLARRRRLAAPRRAGEPVGVVVGVAVAGAQGERGAAAPARCRRHGIGELRRGRPWSARCRGRVDAPRWWAAAPRGRPCRPRSDTASMPSTGSALMPSALPTPRATPRPTARSTTAVTAARQAGLRAVVTAGRVAAQAGSPPTTGWEDAEPGSRHPRARNLHLRGATVPVRR